MNSPYRSSAFGLDGEFGGSERVVVLDAVGVANDRQSKGIGSRLMQGLIDEVRDRGGRELRTQARWDQSGLLVFFAKAGFRLAPSVVLERRTGKRAGYLCSSLLSSNTGGLRSPLGPKPGHSRRIGAPSRSSFTSKAWKR